MKSYLNRLLARYESKIRGTSFTAGTNEMAHTNSAMFVPKDGFNRNWKCRLCSVYTHFMYKTT